MRGAVGKLRKARALVKRGWTQGEYARGGSCLAARVFQDAKCFCAAGAIGAANNKWPSSSLPGMRELSLAVGGDGREADVLNWNDEYGRTQAEVLAAFDKAIDLASQEAAK